MNDLNKESFLKRLIRSPIFLGFLIGILSAVLQAFLFAAGGPEAYGFCVACHTRDLVNDIVNSIFGISLTVAPFSAAAYAPVLSIIGVMIGSFIASRSNREFRLKKSNWSSAVLYFFSGIAVLIFALLLGGCPYRAALRFAYGDFVALIGILAMAFGVFVGTRIVLAKMKKQLKEEDI
ncbi:MAG: hypothetical protein DRO88_10790 [Promethearchaeia archaeon]|nr:MAG: hypothetical protein DRO88_10790 [Candidatus Lokiarchaeia archaeon]